MKLHTLMIGAFGVLAGLNAAAEVPEYYQVLAKSCSLAPSTLPIPAIPSQGRDLWEVCGISTAIRPDAVPTETSKSAALFALPGEFRSLFLAVRPEEFPASVAIAAGTLRNAAGTGVIAGENIHFSRAGWYLKRENWEDSRHIFLTSGDRWQLDEAQTLWLQVTFHVPSGTPPGVYRGTLELTIGANRYPVEVALTALNGQYEAPEGAWGMFIPGDFYNPAERGTYINMPPEWWTAENLDAYYHYWATRGFNSPILFHLYADLQVADGKIEARFPYLERTAEWMNRHQLNGPLGVDLRNLSWWSYAVSRKLLQEGKSVAEVSGPLGVSGADGINLGHTPEEETYPMESRPIYAEAVRQLVEFQKNSGAPRFLYLTEEEIGYPTIKTKGYDFFNPVTEEVAGKENILLVDNAVGYAYSAIDRGARDHVAFRSYNNWTEESLADAHRDGAAVWHYNGGWNRQFAPYLIRIGATAYHQWADGWATGGPWFATEFSAQGVAPSLGIERTAEGLADLFYFRKLEEYIGRCQSAHLDAEAEKLQKLHAELFARYPVNSIEYATASAQLNDAKLDQMRWRCTLAISEAQVALGEAAWYTPPAPQGEPAFALAAHPVAQASAANADAPTYQAAIPSVLPILDGVGDDPAWAGREAYPFVRTRAEEARLRAWASSEEEYRNFAPPSGSSMAVVYDAQGLYLWAGANHVDPARCKHADDDPALWEDDDFEFFFQRTPSEATSQLIVSAAGKRVLLRDGQVVGDSGIQVAMHAPLNASGGSGLELFVPWTALGVSAMPGNGTVWGFNVCRSYHGGKEYTSYAPVSERFGVGNGRLYFGGAALDGALQVSGVTEVLYPGENTVQATFASLDQPLVVSAVTPEGKIAASVDVPQSASHLRLPVTVGGDATSGTWQLRFQNPQGETLGVLPLSVRIGLPALFVTDLQLIACNGGSLELTLTPQLGDASLKTHPLILGWQQGSKRYKLGQCELSPGVNRITIGIQNLPPGAGEVLLSLNGHEQSFPGEILPSPQR